MNFDPRTQVLSKIQQLTGSQSGILHDLVKLNLIQPDELNKLINQLTVDRFLKGQQYIEFAHKLNSSDIDEQVHIISRCYYGMYHLARAAIFHTKRAEYLPTDIGIICQNALRDADEILKFCIQYLQKRGVKIAI